MNGYEILAPSNMKDDPNDLKCQWVIAPAQGIQESAMTVE
jgi:hypothetical protein